MVAVSKDCFTHDESVKFIDVLKNRMGANVYSNEDLRSYLSYGLSSGRSTTTFTRKHIIGPIQDSAKNGRFPLYILLNLITGDDSQKHAIVMIIMPVGKLSAQKYHMTLFDSNGPLDRKGEIYEQKIFQVLDAAQTEIHLQISDVMANKPALNTVGRGFCDAFALYFIYQNVVHATKTPKDVKDRVDELVLSFDTTQKTRRTGRMLATIRETIKKPKKTSHSLIRSHF